MTTLELFRKHRKGEVSRDRFLYEVRRDSNLPWVTNTTSYDDAVKILKNKGIIREAQFEPQNITTDPAVDRVNPYALKREVEKLLSKEKVLTNDSYKEALNKAAKKLANPQAVKASMFANADSVAKADANLQTQEVKKANHVDKKNGMKKAKGQQMPKATSAPTKENKKTKKPKGVEIMKEKGVEGSEKVIKESVLSTLTSFLKKKLNLAENSPYHDHSIGQMVPTPHGEGVIREINGGTLCVEVDGNLYDVQMNVVQKLKEKDQDQAQAEIGAKQEYESGFEQLEEETPKTEMYTDEPGGDEPLFKDEEDQIIDLDDRVQTMDGEKGTVVWKSRTSDFIIVDLDEEGQISIHASDVKKIEDDEEEDEMDENLFVKGTGPQAATLVATQPSSKNALKSAGYKEIPNTQDVR